jgi:hypothetical protein
VFSSGGIYALISPTSADLALQGMQTAAEHGVFVAALGFETYET